MDFPSTQNNFLSPHVEQLVRSFKLLSGQDLIEVIDAQALFFADFALLSHGTETNPIFNYGNLKALELFEMTWEELTALPSRLSAELGNQAQRELLLREVSQKGYIQGYSGIRISKSGQRFKMKDATIWNVSDTNGLVIGQAAMFAQWTRLP